MRIGLPLLTLLVLSALAAGSAVAQDASSDSSASGNSGATGVASVPAAADTGGAKQDSQSGSKDGGSTDKAASGKDKGNVSGDNSGRTPKPDKAGVRGVTGKDAAPAIPIDTSIVVNQGRDAKSAKKPSAKDKDTGSKPGVAISAKDQAGKDGQADAPKQAPPDIPARNAVGARLDKADIPKPIDGRNATGVVTTPVISAAPDPKANQVPQPANGNVAASDPGKLPGSAKVQTSAAPTAAIAPGPAPASGAAMPGSSTISGTGLVRPVVRTGMITGTPKPNGAVVSGSNTATRH